jgi:hypothetical protein
LLLGFRELSCAGIAEGAVPLPTAEPVVLAVLREQLSPSPAFAFSQAAIEVKEQFLAPPALVGVRQNDPLLACVV